MRKVFLVGCWGLAVGIGLAAETNTMAPPALADAPVNTWVKAMESKTGGREYALFVYAGRIKKFVLASGIQTPGNHVFPRHYDTEEFDLAALKWVNAYPPAVAAGRPESGPVGEAYSKRLAGAEFGAGNVLYKDGDSLRIGAGGQWLTTKLNYQFACVPENGKVYAYLYDKTVCYDPEARTWQDLKAKPRTSSRIWGSMCYDPVNKEILHSGGDGDSTSVGTWAYGIETNEWRKLEFNSVKLKALGESAKPLRWQAKALLGACCNRFAISETAAEAKADLVVQATALAGAAEKFVKEIKAAGLAGTDKTAGEVAVKRLESAATALKVAAPGLSGTIVQEKIAAIRAIRVIFEQVVDALAVEPPGRARSQTAYDPVHKKIVLFGGDGLDRVLSDTWLYDCATRTWEQRFPEKCPAPRAGHILAWLPKSGQVVLAGGYSRVDLPQEIWSYDVAANVWKMLLHVPLAPEDSGRKMFSPNCPRVTSLLRQLSVQVGAVNEDDVLVCPVSQSDNSMVTWVCKVDPAKVDEAGTAARAVASGSYTFNRIDPATWENAAKPEPEKTRQFLNALPTNQWTALPCPMYAPGARNRWGTAAYDTARHQFLFWGGGHSTSCENDVSHFSVRGGFWTVGYHPDDPIEIIYASVPTPFSFNDRPHVPMHAYHSYAYDPVADRMFYVDRVYDQITREWEPSGSRGMPPTRSSLLVSTPHGVVWFCEHAPFIFDAKAYRWEALPWDGIWPKCGGMDVSGGIYDYKRDCLWVSASNGFFKYDFKAGRGEAVTGVKPRFTVYGVKLVFGREAVHVPDADLILIWSLASEGNKTFAWSPGDGQYYWAELPAMDGGKLVANFGRDASDGLAYDPKLKLVLLNKNANRTVYALKLDRATLKMTELKDPPESDGK